MEEKVILYIGNKLSIHGYTPTSVETLGEAMKTKFTVFSTSSQQNFMLRLLDMLWQIVKLRNKIDYVLIDTYSSKAFYFSFFSARLARFFQIPYIPILHGGNLPSRLKRSPYLSKKLFHNSYQNVSPSKYLMTSFAKAGYASIVIPNYIEISNYEFKRRYDFSPKLLWVRAFDEVYNPVMGVEVLKILLEIFPNATLCMVGPDKDGSLLNVKNVAKKYGIEKHLIITGKLKKEEWIDLSAGYDIFLNTTNFDNMPVSVIEAMGLGLPVVSTNVGGLPFLLDDNMDSLLIDANDSKAMADAVRKIIDNADFAQSLATAARKKVTHFDINKVLEKWKKLLV